MRNLNCSFVIIVQCIQLVYVSLPGPRSRRVKKKASPEEKRPRTAFSASQLTRLKVLYNIYIYIRE